MSFQWIIDDCESLSINRRDVVAQTITRDGSVRAVKRGDGKKVFTVRVPDGIRWSELKDDIAAAEAYDKYTQTNISIPFASFPWYYGDVDPGTDETYTVICTQFPDWTIFARNQVGWSGPFVFVEV